MGAQMTPDEIQKDREAGAPMTEAPERIWATEDADLYTITICACEAGRAKAARIAAMATKIPEDE